MNVKDIIREKRLALGMTMKEVADKVGVSEATISRWESGEIANMRRGAIFSLTNNQTDEQEQSQPSILLRAEKELPPEKLRELADVAEFYLVKYGKKKVD